MRIAWRITIAVVGGIASLGSADVGAQKFLGQAPRLDPLPIPDFKPAPPAKRKEQQKKIDESRFNRPIYNAATKSYFEYVINRGGEGSGGSAGGIGWTQAKAFAESKIFHGVRGRLAVVKDKDTNDFIVEHFRPEDGTWIGLRYFCDLNALVWVTGEVWPLTGYQNWGRPWNVQGGSSTNQFHSKCLRSEPWQPVHYWGAQTGYKWNANGTGKYFAYMIVEYPTGQP